MENSVTASGTTSMRTKKRRRKSGRVKYRFQPKSLQLLAKKAVKPGQLIALPHVLDLGIGQVWVWDCSRDVVLLQIAMYCP